MRLTHPIFHSPFPVDLDLSPMPTPAHYASWFAGRQLGPELPSWRVHREDAPEIPGALLRAHGFEDSPDCEWISGGSNTKGPQGLALGRQGNVFHWGFAGHPGQMTSSARRVFLNVLVYMTQFEGQGPTQLHRSPPHFHRSWAREYAWALEQDLEPRDRSFAILSTGLRRSIRAAPEGPMRFVGRHEEYLHSTDANASIDIDRELLSWGVSNRKLEFFTTALARLHTEDGREDALLLLERYASDLPGPEIGPRLDARALRAWVEANRSRLYFSDTLGYRWRISDHDLASDQSTGER